MAAKRIGNLCSYKYLSCVRGTATVEQGPVAGRAPERGWSKPRQATVGRTAAGALTSSECDGIIESITKEVIFSPLDTPSGLGRGYFLQGWA